MARADPHCHTTASDGMVTAAELVDAAVKAGLDLIAVTDHDTMGSVAEVQTRGEAVGLTIVAGQEVTTKWPAQTHVLGWFLERQVKRGMSLADTVAAIHDQGGLVIIPHPFMPVYFGSIQPGMLRRLLEKQSVDGIEMLSTVPIGATRRKVLHEFFDANRERLGAPIGASDCHFGGSDIGRALTAFDGDFRTAVMECTTKPVLGVRRRVPTGIALRQQWRALIELPIKRMRG
ncbi:MAG: PHP domain-containing protein [Candidatus Dormibacteraeota bacterium]|nr:PHP domain-containing protein [Candidatus Dormibacteraeota bacterium]